MGLYDFERQMGGLTAPQGNAGAPAPMTGPMGGQQNQFMSPGMMMTMQALQNMSSMRRGGQAGITPIQAYQDSVLAQQEAERKKKEASQGGIGNYNPGQYTTESWAEFMAGGRNDPSVLVAKTTDRSYKGVTERFNPDTGKMEIISDVSETAAAAGEIAGAQTGAQAFATNQENFRSNQSKKRLSIGNSERRNRNVSGAIKDARALIKEFGATGWKGAITMLPDSDAKRLKNKLDTIRANVGFATLQDMRDASETGGALGQVTERELAFLQSVLGALDQSGNAGDLLGVFDNIEANAESSIGDFKTAYDFDAEQYGLPTYYRDKAAAEAEGTPDTTPPNAERTEVRRGKLPDGRTVIEYSDGSTEVQ